MVLFCNYKTYSVAVDEKGKKHKAQGGKRVMYTSHNPVWDAKNRNGLPDELDLSFAGLKNIFQPVEPVKEPELSPLEYLEMLMTEAGIEDYELRDFIVSRGKQPAEVQVSEYPEDFIRNYCLRHWAKIESSIKQIKGE